MEKQYKVKCLSLGGPGNKVFKKNDVVEQKNFPGSNMNDLVKNGFIVEVEPSEKNTSSILDLAQNSLGNNSNENPPAVKTIDEFKMKDLKRELTSAEIEFLQDATKEDLYNLWLSIKK
jgi:hypothetical protein